MTSLPSTRSTSRKTELSSAPLLRYLPTKKVSPCCAISANMGYVTGRQLLDSSASGSALMRTSCPASMEMLFGFTGHPSSSKFKSLRTSTSRPTVSTMVAHSRLVRYIASARFLSDCT